MIKEFAEFVVTGHVKIVDDLGNVLLDKCNAIHSQNMARVFARALANESNFYVYRIAFGNGGTTTDAAFTITYNDPNDGQPPDVRTWDSRLYNETYSEIIDDASVNIGVDPGSAGPAGIRPGGGSVPSNDPTVIEHVSGPGVRSNELGLTSQVVVYATLNPSEPTGQYLTDVISTSEDTESSFSFDEIGLYTTGSPAADSNAYQNIEVGDRTSEDDSGLLASTPYDFWIGVDADVGSPIHIEFTTPSSGSGTGGEITYGDICEAINTGDIGWGFSVDGSPVIGSSPLPTGSTIAITDNSLSYPTITGEQTFGYLKFTSGSVGSISNISVTPGTVNDVFASMNPPTGGAILSAVPGSDAGVQNNPVNPSLERERLLTHLIFSPILKAANRTLSITYTLTISIARSTA